MQENLLFHCQNSQNTRVNRCLFFLLKKWICHYHKLYKLYIGWLSEDFYLVFFLFDILCDFSARLRVEHAYLGQQLESACFADSRKQWKQATIS